MLSFFGNADGQSVITQYQAQQTQADAAGCIYGPRDDVSSTMLEALRREWLEAGL